MMFLKIILYLLLLLGYSNLFAMDLKPSISIFTIDKNKLNKSIKISVSSQLNQRGFLTKNGNKSLEKISNSRFKSFQYIIDNSDALSQISDTELLIILKLKKQLVNQGIAKVFISSEIFNAKTKTFISSWSTPRKIINFPNNCDQICRNLLISKSTILLADQLGRSIGGILSAKSTEVKNYNNLTKTYNFKLYNFRHQDIIHLSDVMINEFPGFVKISNEQSYAEQASWNYYSTSNSLKLKKWLILTLSEMNFKLDEDYELLKSDNNFFIKRFPVFNSIGSKGNTKKFN
tara:strand:- start:204 stop:1070 length:867 start_codon:yes stop_codon:yes gene_type:complete